MSSLEEFEKALAAEKAQQGPDESGKHRRHRHRHGRDRFEDRGGDGDKDRHRHRHHRAHDGDDNKGEDGHRHKRSRHSRDADKDESRHRHRHRDRERGRQLDGEWQHEVADWNNRHEKVSDPKGDLPLPDEEEPRKGPKRDSWMTAPSALDVDYIHRGKERKTSAPRQESLRVIHSRELNTQLANPDHAKEVDDIDVSNYKVDYTFGDEGSQWRMTKLKAVYTTAKSASRPVEEVAVERFGSLRQFDDAREERNELDRRKVYGEGYAGKDKPTGDLFRERRQHAGAGNDTDPPAEAGDELGQGKIVPDTQGVAPGPRLDQTSLNRLRAQMMKAKLKGSPDAATREAEYNAAAAGNTRVPLSGGNVVLGVMDNRMLAGSRAEAKAVTTKRGTGRGTVEANEDMSIDDMVREERRTRGQAGGEGMRLAERIAKDAKFDDDLEYMDDNAAKLASRVHKTETSLKNVAINEFQKMNRILDSCQLCHQEDKGQLPVAPVIALGTRAYLTLATTPELSEGGAVIVPVAHKTNLLECDDDEWEEMRNFMKSLTRLYHEQGREVLFYENAAAPQRRMHAAMFAVPIPYDLGDTAPAFFREAMLSADEEWSQHKKIIDTGRAARDGLGRASFRRSIAKEMPYFHVWFNLDGGLGHVVEDADRWPRGDLFAREIIGGMLDCEPDVIKKQGRWHRSDQRTEGFKKRWRKFDWTRVLTEQG